MNLRILPIHKHYEYRQNESLFISMIAFTIRRIALHKTLKQAKVSK
jgi:hypothetical protein